MAFRVQIFYGTWTDTISCHRMVFVYMDALMGKRINHEAICFQFQNLDFPLDFHGDSWLRLGTTNHDPYVILQYYLDAVEKINGI